MAYDSLIKTPNLTRELSIELTGIGDFMSDQFNGQADSELFMADLEDFKSSSAKLKLHSIFMLYNDFEGLLKTQMDESELQRVRRELRLNFPYLSSQEQLTVYFLPNEQQQCAISCFFLSEVITRIMDIHGQSQRLKALFDITQEHYAACKSPSSDQLTPILLEEVMNMPTSLFKILSSSLGKNWILNLYQRTFDKLQTHYSNLPSFVHLQGSMEEIFAAY